MPETNKFAGYLKAIMDALKGNAVDSLSEPYSNVELYLGEIAQAIADKPAPKKYYQHNIEMTGTDCDVIFSIITESGDAFTGTGLQEYLGSITEGYIAANGIVDVSGTKYNIASFKMDHSLMKVGVVYFNNGVRATAAGLDEVASCTIVDNVIEL